jgi:hypothetical protein
MAATDGLGGIMEMEKDGLERMSRREIESPERGGERVGGEGLVGIWV